MKNNILNISIDRASHLVENTSKAALMLLHLIEADREREGALDELIAYIPHIVDVQFFGAGYYYEQNAGKDFLLLVKDLGKVRRQAMKTIAQHRAAELQNCTA